MAERAPDAHPEIETPRTLADPPHAVRVVENLWIPLSDGTCLAARAWLPEDAAQHPVPAILEYIPYRKRDLTRQRDALNHPYLAGHGYACVRVDLRGSGDSEGVMHDQFLEQEQRDGYEVVEWLAQQAWCDGKVGMFGISWGGFAGLQVAALQPPSLGAIVVASATDDLYVDNMHYMGGCLLGDNLSEATTMFAFNGCPPDPAIVGEGWRDGWLQRLDGSGLWLKTWLEHPHRDAYWTVGSVRDDFAAVKCPVLCASGWADGYSNAVLRLVEHLDAPCRGLIGPWSHQYPHLAVPGPAIGFLQETLRWFDHWLKGDDQGVMDDPALRVWMQDSVPPATAYEQRPGRWVAEPTWPGPNIEPRTTTLAGRRRGADDGAAGGGGVAIQSPLTVGLFAGKWCSYAAVPDLPGDQRQEDGGALVFDSAPLDGPLEILGRPEVTLVLTANRPVAMVAVRISDVHHDGSATRVTFGLLNLTHREGHAHPEPLRPGARYRVTVPLNGVAQNFPTGHRIRVAISSSYWPLAWPSPEPVELTLWPDESTLTLPVRAPRPEDVRLRRFPPPEASPPITQRTITPAHAKWLVHHDMATNTSTLDVVRHDGHFEIEETGTEIVKRTREWYSARGADFASPRGETETLRAFRRGDWRVEARTRTVLTCDATNFYLHACLDAFEDDRRVFARTWDEVIPRRLV
ncbi:MAG: CocE/NonD family hydrolase [Myxococcales bacterium]|nr:CocE/NonD family hydrolase [Myxococcales bacterium]MCB9535674.1 CocE/NonD family hydrolase [Myxococcales bacterium]